MEGNPGITLFQPSSINIENPHQNQEEDEDLEEQKRRQEEIQNFLTTAMDEFNYDEQSTINSSANVSVDDTYNTQNAIMEKYKNGSLENQLKILYEVRVKEVKSLTEQLQELKNEIQKQKEINGKTALLLEAEKDRAKISSQQAQILLVNKNEEISKFKNEIDSLRATIISLETTVKAVNDEYTLSKQSNKELIEQLSLMHNGLTTNTISDRQLQEQHHSEISQLHHLLDSAHMKLHRKEKEFKELEQALKTTVNDKDTLMIEKSTVINQLTENLENALERCQEFSQVIEKLSQENKTFKLSTTTNDLMDSIRTIGLADKTEIVKALQRELEKAQEAHSKQNVELQSLRETCDKLSHDCNTYENNEKRYKNELDMWKKKYDVLNKDFGKSNENIKTLKAKLEESRNNMIKEIERYELRIKSLENTLASREKMEACDRSVQVSAIADSSHIEQEHQKEKIIDTLNAEIVLLNKKLADTEAHLSQMKVKVLLEKERENLIKSLQEKAVKFEEIIKQKQSKLDYLSVGVNTDTPVTDALEQATLLKTKYETNLVQKEIKIRTELKKEFDLKLQNELSKKTNNLQDKNCENCRNLLSNIKQLKVATDMRNDEINTVKEQMKQDREAVAMLLEEWSGKFIQIENEKKGLHLECANLKSTCDQLILKLKTKEAGDSKLYEVIKKECEETIKMWNKNTLENLQQYALTQQATLKYSNKKIEDCCNTADKEISAIELQYLQKKQLLEHNMTYKKKFKYHT